MSGLMPTILLIVVFLVLALVLRMAGRHARSVQARDTEPGEASSSPGQADA